MDYLRESLQGVLRRIGYADPVCTPSQPPELPVSKFELCLGLTYDVVTWKNQRLSFIIILAIQLFGSLIILSELRFMPTLLLLGILAFACYRCCEHYYDTHDPTTLPKTGRKLKEYVLDRITYLRQLRLKNPGAFCTLVSSAFVVLLVASRYIGLFHLTYLIIFSPFIISKLCIPSDDDLNIFNWLHGSTDAFALADTGGVASNKDTDSVASFRYFSPEDLEHCSVNSESSEEANSLENEVASIPSISDFDSERGAVEEEEDEFIGGLEPRHSVFDTVDATIDFIQGHFDTPSRSSSENSFIPTEEPKRLQRDRSLSTSSSESEEGATGAVSLSSPPSVGSNSDSEFEIVDMSESSSTSK